MRARVGCGNGAGAGKERCMPSKLPSWVLGSLQQGWAMVVDRTGAPPALDQAQ